MLKIIFKFNVYCIKKLLILVVLSIESFVFLGINKKKVQYLLLKKYINLKKFVRL